MVVTSKLGTYVASFNIKSATYKNKSANLKHIQVLQMALHSQYYLLRIYPVSTKTFVLRLLFTRITNKLLTMRSHEGVLTWKYLGLSVSWRFTWPNFVSLWWTCRWGFSVIVRSMIWVLLSRATWWKTWSTIPRLTFIDYFCFFLLFSIETFLFRLIFCNMRFWNFFYLGLLYYCWFLLLFCFRDLSIQNGRC